jgi:Ni,Fe-hydrogenase III small subunit
VAPGVNATEALPSPAVAVPIVGACGTVVAVIEDDALDAGPVADAFVPVTAKV